MGTVQPKRPTVDLIDSILEDIDAVLGEPPALPSALFEDNGCQEGRKAGE